MEHSEERPKNGVSIDLLATFVSEMTDLPFFEPSSESSMSNVLRIIFLLSW